MQRNLAIRTLFLLTFFSVAAFATEILKPVSRPSSEILIGGIADLRDDVYSGDGRFAAEISPIKYFSIFTDVTYRLVSYEFDTMLHDQIHELIDLRVNGLNATTVGTKVFPLENYGLTFAYRFPSRDGDRRERFPRISAELQSVYDFSRRMQFGYALEFLTYGERTNFQPGNEIGSRFSCLWNLSNWEFTYAFLFRHRVEQSLNYNLDKPYRKMDDEYSGYRMHMGVGRNIALGTLVLKPGIAYEITRGTLFGFETGHRVELLLRVSR